MLKWELWQSNDHCNSTILQRQWKIAPQFRRNMMEVSIDQSDTIFTYCFLWKPNCTPDLSNISKFSGTGSCQQGKRSSTNGTDNGDGDAGTDEPAQWLLAPLVGSCLGRRGSDPTKGASWRVWLVNDIWRHGAMRVSWVMSFCSNFYWPLLECDRWWLIYLWGSDQPVGKKVHPLNGARSCNNTTRLWIISTNHQSPLTRRCQKSIDETCIRLPSDTQRNNFWFLLFKCWFHVLFGHSKTSCCKPHQNGAGGPSRQDVARSCCYDAREDGHLSLQQKLASGHTTLCNSSICPQCIAKSAFFTPNLMFAGTIFQNTGLKE